MADYYILLPPVAAATWKDSVDTSASLPASGNTTGDARVARDTGHIWVWTGAAWVDESGGGGLSPPVTNAQLATMAANTVKANVTGSTATPTDVAAVTTPSVPSSFVIRNTDGLISDFDPSYQVYEWNDFIGGGSPPADLTVNNNGSNSKSSIRGAGSTSTNPGVWSLQTGTTNTGNGNLFGSNVDQVFSPVGGGAFTWEALVQVPVLSDGTDRFTVLAGLSDDPYNSNVTPSNAFYFSYSDNVTSGRWTFYSVSTSNSTVDTGVSVTAGAWFKLKFTINAAGTSVQVYVNGAATGSPITTNIPTTNLMLAFINKKSAGTNNREFYIDYYKVIKTFTTPR